MKIATQIALILFALTGTTSGLAQEQAAIETVTAEAITEPVAAEASTTEPAVETIELAAPAPDAGMQATTEDQAQPANPMGRHCKHKAGMMGGKGGPGKDHDGKKACDMKKGGGCKAKHQEVVDRLDMIEARMAKIEAMLEALLRRQ